MHLVEPVTFMWYFPGHIFLRTQFFHSVSWNRNFLDARKFHLPDSAYSTMFLRVQRVKSCVDGSHIVGCRESVVRNILLLRRCRLSCINTACVRGSLWISCVLLQRRTPGDPWICPCVIDPSSAHGMTMITTGESFYGRSYCLFKVESIARN